MIETEAFLLTVDDSLWEDIEIVKRARDLFPHAVEIGMRKHNEVLYFCAENFGPSALNTLSHPVRHEIIKSRLWWTSAILGSYFFKDPKHAMEVKLRFCG